MYDGCAVEVVELRATAAGNEAVLQGIGGRRKMFTVGLRQLLSGERARVIPDLPGPSADDLQDPASVVLAGLTDSERAVALERAAHIREVLTGYRSGSAELAAVGEPRAEFDPGSSLTSRYQAKAAEVGVSLRTVQQWVSDYRSNGEAGLARVHNPQEGSAGRADERWIETALEVMVEHTDQSRPSRTMVIDRTNARVVARYGPDVVFCPSRATAFRVLQELEQRHPTFRLSTKRNRDIAARPAEAYGKLRPTRPGEYLLMDTTRLDVFAMDPVTLRWVQAELTVGMDWYTRCITGIRVTPVSTKSVDAAATLYQAYRPPPAGEDWPAHAVWPEHGVPRSVLVDHDTVERPSTGASGPAIVPETLVVDHGKIYLSEHLTSVCARMGISIQPARLRTGRDKGPVERFFRTVREDLLQALPGYKGPDVHSRGLDPESEAFFYLDELEAIIREWVAVVYHHRPYDGLVDPHLPGLRLSPATMFEHGMARAGYIEAPRDPGLAFEFLKTVWRTVQHYGVEYGGRRYNGSGLDPYRNMTSPHQGVAKGRWPIQVDPDDVTRVYFRDPDTRHWRTLQWEHAPSMEMPLSEDALRFARRLAAATYTYPDDKIAVADLLERWNIGLVQTRAERRMALRMARERSALVAEDNSAEDTVARLPSVSKVLQRSSAEVPDAEPPSPDDATAAPTADAGDDDDADFDDNDGADGDADADDSHDGRLAAAQDVRDNFYADALEDV